MQKIYFFQIIGMFFSWIYNAFLLTRLKFHLRGKYFWFRSLATSGIAETVFTILSVTFTLFGSMPTQEISHIVVWSFTIKLISTVIFSYPVTFIVSWLKKSECIDVYDNISGLNPFKVINDDNKITR
ncbi:MAG: hypothetical protein A3F13_09690 [Gammaproteobacteria bacterium RIFCSPHIGHO2_12_FULL_40_19]|nr:MAG: hypothetical protein A3F13_09690 [Gammaproteobacteria bacterium RIFCSPHIGHO2_12_FULL_40_19]